MIKRLSFLALLITLFISNIAYSQIENPYIKFESKDLKSDPVFSKNFNAGDYSEKVLYDCMIALLNEFRMKYAYLGPFKHHIDLDSAANMQATYQAFKEEKTSLNVAPYKEPMYRLRKFGLSHRGYELNMKGKATYGAKEYSYYDMCMDLLRPILKNLKLVPHLLSPEYSYVGFAYDTDQYLRTAYATVILGNDLTFRPYKVSPAEKDAPISKGKGKMDYYDEAICKKCMADNASETLPRMLTVDADGNVFMQCEDYKALKKVIGRTGDGIVLDFIQNIQYDCDNIIVDNDKIFKGIVSDIITYEDILEGNEITGKSTQLRSIIATVPEEINLDEPIEIAVILLKEDKVACKSVVKKSVEAHNARYDEPINFIPDVTTIKSVGEWIPTAEHSEFEVILPFTDLKKLQYTYADMESLFDEIDLPPYKVTGIDLDVCNSINYIKDAVQIRNQKARGASIAAALQGEFGVIPKVNYTDSWEAFKKSIVDHPEYYDLSFGTKDEAISMLRANYGAIAKELEDDYLSQQRYAKITVKITYKMDGNNEQIYANYKFNQAMEEKNYKLAMGIQEFMIYRVENERYKYELLNQMEIPKLAVATPFLINKLYMQYYLSPDFIGEACKTMTNLAKMYPTNAFIAYNQVVCAIFAEPITTVAQIPVIQSRIDRLYTMAALPKEDINTLNLEFQIKILDFLSTQPSNTTTINLNANTYIKIKSIMNPVLESWEAAYKLASLFIQNNDYEYAIKLMNPFIDSRYVSEDFIFSYISLAGSTPRLIQSSYFMKGIKLGLKRNPSYLCTLLNKMSITIMDNVEVKAFLCEECQ